LPYDQKAEDYINGIKSDVDPNSTELVVIVLSRKELKSKIKKALVGMGLIS
jgi:hypothetical protein